MKKCLAVILSLCLMATLASASAEGSVEDQLYQVVMSALEQEELIYEYDAENQWFTLSFDMDSSIQSADVTIFLYDDMVSVTVDCPLKVQEDWFEKAAIFTTLANNKLYYAQLRVDRDDGWIACRSCNVIENVLPTEAEILTLLYMPLNAMDDYGNGLAAICTMGADPYEAIEACWAAM